MPDRNVRLALGAALVAAVALFGRFLDPIGVLALAGVPAGLCLGWTTSRYESRFVVGGGAGVLGGLGYTVGLYVALGVGVFEGSLFVNAFGPLVETIVYLPLFAVESFVAYLAADRLR